MSAWSDAVAALATAPIGWYKMDETSGTTLVDSAASPVNGTYPSGDITFGADKLVPGGDGTAIVKGTGTTAITAGKQVNSGTFSTAFTVKTTDTVGNVFNVATSSTVRTRIELGASGDVVVEVKGTDAGVTWTGGVATLADGNAHLVILRVQNATQTLIVDGTTVGTGTVSVGGGLTAAPQLGVLLSSPIAGTYDEWLIWDTYISDADADALYDGWTGTGPAATATLSATLTRKTANITLNAPPSLSLTATRRARTAVVELDNPNAPDRAVSLAATLRAKTATHTLTISTGLQASLAGGLRRKTAAVTLTVPLVASVTGTLQRRTAAVTLNIAPGIVLAGTLQRRTATFGLTPAVATEKNRAGGRVRDGLGVVVWEPPVELPPAHLSTVPIHSQDVAVAYTTPVLSNGRVTSITPTTVTKARHRDRILVGGRDVTFWRGIPTPTPDYSLIEPLMYGSGSLRLPQLNPLFERPGISPLWWLRLGSPVVVQRVDVATNTVVATDYRGIIVDWAIDGSEWTATLGGEVAGRAALRDKQVPIFKSTRDIGYWAFEAVKQLGVWFAPRLGPTIGIKLQSMGGMTHLDHLLELCAKAVQLNGDQWTIMPQSNGNGPYRMQLKDRTTRHATVYFDDARMKPNLQRGLSEEPERIFVTGVTPAGQRVRFGAYPGLIQGPAPPYPFADERSFGIGTTDAQTDSGSGISAMIWRLTQAGYLNRADNLGGFDADVADAIDAMGQDVGIAASGRMTVTLWRALYDLDRTGYSLNWSGILPAAERPRVRPWDRTASGAVIRHNPLYDPHRIVVDRTIDMGPGFERGQLRRWAWGELFTDGHWVGSLDSNLSVIAGNHTPGSPLTAADIMPARALRPGQNLWAPLFDGGTLFHISGIDVGNNGHSVKLALDTRARDTMKAWEIIARNRESRRNPTRIWVDQYRSSQITKDGLGEWDEVGGIITDQVALKGDSWTVFPVVAGQTGTVARVKIQLGIPREFACAVFGAEISVKRLNHLVPAPLAKTRNDKDGSGEPWYERKRVMGALRSRYLLYAAGTHDEPCGLGEGRKKDGQGNDTGAPVTGIHSDDASFSYTTRAEPVLYVAVWVAADTSVTAGRIFWPQLEVGS